MRILICSLILCCFVLHVYGQPEPLIETLQFYGDSCFGLYDDPWAFTTCHDGGFLLAGYSERFNQHNAQAWLVRVDSIGNLVWEYPYGFTDYANAVVQTPDGGFVAAGWGSPGWYMEFMLLKTDSLGNQVWLQHYPEARGAAYDMVPTADGGFVISGQVEYLSGPDAYLMKTDPDGNVLWNHTYDLGGMERFTKVAACQDGGFMMVGRHNVEINGSVSLFAIRVDHKGDTLWQRVYERPGSQFANDVKGLADGSLVVVGTNLATDNNYGANDNFIACLSDNGEILWWRNFGSPDSSEGLRAVLPVNDGFLVAGGLGVQNEIVSRAYLAKCDLAGNHIWHRVFNVRDYSCLIGVTPLADGRYVLAGKTGCIISPFIYAPDAFFLRTGPDESLAANDPRESVPTEFAIGVCPNPFNSIAQISLSVPRSQVLTLALFDVTGRQVKTWGNYRLNAGMNHLTIDGQELTSGIFFLRAIGADLSGSAKIVHLK